MSTDKKTTSAPNPDTPEVTPEESASNELSIEEQLLQHEYTNLGLDEHGQPQEGDESPDDGAPAVPEDQDGEDEDSAGNADEPGDEPGEDEEGEILVEIEEDEHEALGKRGREILADRIGKVVETRKTAENERDTYKSERDEAIAERDAALEKVSELENAVATQSPAPDAPKYETVEQVESRIAENLELQANLERVIQNGIAIYHQDGTEVSEDALRQRALDLRKEEKVELPRALRELASKSSTTPSAPKGKSRVALRAVKKSAVRRPANAPAGPRGSAGGDKQVASGKTPQSDLDRAAFYKGGGTVQAAEAALLAAEMPSQT